MAMAENMFFTLEKNCKRVIELEKKRFVELQNLAPLDAMEGNLDADEVYHIVPGQVRGLEFHTGKEYVGRDRYFWVRKIITLPEHRDGYEVYGLFNFGTATSTNSIGFESLLYVNGHPYQAVDTNHHDVNFEKLAGKEVELTFLFWTGLEGGELPKEIRHHFCQAQIGYLHSATDEFFYLTRTALQTLEYLSDEQPEKHRALHAVDKAINRIDWDEEYFRGTVQDALNQLKQELDTIRGNNAVTVNAVGHTHIDVAWKWRYKHSREKAMRSFSTVLRLMEEFDEYIFLQSQPQLYAYLKEDCPELYEKIKARVVEGRWEAEGGMWLEADCNLTSGESLVRQFLYGMRFFQEEFGHSCEYLWLPDVFGYSWALPQILKGVGIRTFMTTKISWNQFNSMPHDIFRWRGIDGTEILTYFITKPEEHHQLTDRRGTYNGPLTPKGVVGSWIKFRDKNLISETLIPYGFGDGGGGVNRDMLKTLRAMKHIPGLPETRTTKAGSFFDRLHEVVDHTDEYVPTWDGELYLEYHRGTYTSQAYNKRTNRHLEFALQECEALSAYAKCLGGTYDTEKIRHTWQTVLRNQFHDVIPGSAIKEVYEDCHREYGEAEQDLQGLTCRALKSILTPAENTVTLWHLGSFARTDTVFIEEKRTGYFVGADNVPLPFQRTADGYYVSVSLPALSFRTLRFMETETLPESASSFVPNMEKRTLETPFYRIAWNENGFLSRIFDIENNREVLACDAVGNELRIYEDKPMDYDNWDIDIFYQFKHETAVLAKAPELAELGALRAVIRFTWTYRHSRFVQDMTVYSNSRRIDFVTKADWHESNRLLKSAFPVAIRSTHATYDIQFGHVERPTHYNTRWDYARFEVVAHKWADLSEEGYGVSILNDCKYGHSIKDNLMQITLLKSGKFPDREADMGEHVFTYALLPHTASPAEGNTIEESVRLNLPVHVEKGSTQAFSAFTSSNRCVAFDAIKKAEDSDTLILRIHECRGSRTVVTLTPGFSMTAWNECNLLEEDSGETIHDSRIETSLRPFEIKTFRIHTGQ